MNTLRILLFSTLFLSCVYAIAIRNSRRRAVRPFNANCYNPAGNLLSALLTSYFCPCNGPNLPQVQSCRESGVICRRRPIFLAAGYNGRCECANAGLVYSPSLGGCFGRCSNGTVPNPAICSAAGAAEQRCVQQCNVNFAALASSYPVCVARCYGTCLTQACDICCPIRPPGGPGPVCTGITQDVCNAATVDEVACFFRCSTLSGTARAICEANCEGTCRSISCIGDNCCPLTPSVVGTPCNGAVTQLVCDNAIVTEITCFAACARATLTDAQFANCQSTCYQNCLTTASSCAVCCPLVPDPPPPGLACISTTPIPTAACTTATNNEVSCVTDNCGGLNDFGTLLCEAGCKAVCLDASCLECCTRVPTVPGPLTCVDTTVVTSLVCFNAFIAEQVCFDGCSTLVGSARAVCEAFCKITCTTAACDDCCLAEPTDNTGFQCTDISNAIITVLPAACTAAAIAEVACVTGCGLVFTGIPLLLCEVGCAATCQVATCPDCCPVVVPTNPGPLTCPADGTVVDSAVCAAAALAESTCFAVCDLFLLPAAEVACQALCVDTCTTVCADCCPETPITGPVACQVGTLLNIDAAVCGAATIAEAICYAGCDIFAGAALALCEAGCKTACLAAGCEDCCLAVSTPGDFTCSDPDITGLVSNVGCVVAAVAETVCFATCDALGPLLQSVCEVGCKTACQLVCDDCCPNPLTTGGSEICAASGGLVTQAACTAAAIAKDVCYTPCALLGPTPARVLCESVCDTACDAVCPTCCTETTGFTGALTCGLVAGLFPPACLAAAAAETLAFAGCAAIPLTQALCESGAKAICLTAALTCAGCCPN